MTKFTIEREIRVFQQYIVEANTLDDAYELLLVGDIDPTKEYEIGEIDAICTEIKE